MAVLLWLPILWLGESHAKASESREEVLQKNKQEVSEQSTNPSHNSTFIHSHSIH